MAQLLLSTNSWRLPEEVSQLKLQPGEKEKENKPQATNRREYQVFEVILRKLDLATSLAGGSKQNWEITELQNADILVRWQQWTAVGSCTKPDSLSSYEKPKLEEAKNLKMLNPPSRQQNICPQLIRDTFNPDLKDCCFFLMQLWQCVWSLAIFMLLVLISLYPPQATDTCRWSEDLWTSQQSRAMTKSGYHPVYLLIHQDFKSHFSELIKLLNEIAYIQQMNNNIVYLYILIIHL